MFSRVRVKFDNSYALNLNKKAVTLDYRQYIYKKITFSLNVYVT